MPSFSESKTSGVIPLTVKFVDTSTETVTSWLWEFGDGEISIEQNPFHTYLDSSIYDVSLTINDSLRITKDELINATNAIDWVKWVQDHLFNTDTTTTEWDAFTKFLGEHFREIDDKILGLKNYLDVDNCHPDLLVHLSCSLGLNPDVVSKVGIKESNLNYDSIIEYDIFNRIVEKEANEDEILALRRFLKSGAQLNKMKGTSRGITETLKFFGIISNIQKLWTTNFNEPEPVTDFFINGLSGADELGFTDQFTASKDNNGTVVEGSKDINVDTHSANVDVSLYHAFISKNYDFKHLDIDITLQLTFNIENWENQWKEDEPNRKSGIILRGKGSDIFDLDEYLEIILDNGEIALNHVSLFGSTDITSNTVNVNFNQVYDLRVHVFRDVVTVYLNNDIILTYMGINEFLDTEGMFGFFSEDSNTTIHQLTVVNIDVTNSVFAFNDEDRYLKYFARFPERMATGTQKFNGTYNYGQPYDTYNIDVDAVKSNLSITGTLDDIKVGLNETYFLLFGNMLAFQINGVWSLFPENVSKIDISGNNIYMLIANEIRLYTLDLNERTLYLNNEVFSETVDDFIIKNNTLYTF